MPPAMVDANGQRMKSQPMAPVQWKLIGEARTYSTAELYEVRLCRGPPPLVSAISLRFCDETAQGRFAKGLREGSIELAVSGMALDSLEESGDMGRLLLYTRIFARVSPERKVDIIRMHQVG